MSPGGRSFRSLSKLGLRRRSFTHYFYDDALWPLSVEFGIVNLLPRTEIELAVGHRHNHLVVDQEAFQV
jgi:hypothetical protein